MCHEIEAILAVFALVWLVAVPICAAQQTPGPINDYIIGNGDVLDIAVWKDEALTKQVTVLPDGKISFPLVGEVVAAGKTLAALKKELEDKLKRYVPDLTLSVLVAQVNSLHVYVIGRVNNPGRFVLNTDVNVMQALSLAGGLNAFANRDQIKIFRKNGKEKKILHFEYDEVAEGKKLEQNVQLQRGDVIVVP